MNERLRPHPAPGSPGTGKASSLATLERVLWQMENGGDPHAILGVDQGTSPADIQLSYLSMVRLLHPDQPAFIQAGLTGEATRAMAALNGAHTELMSAGGQGHRTHASTDHSTTTDGAVAASALIGSAKVMLDNRRWAQADETLHQARAALQGRLHSRCDVMLAWAIWNNPDRDPSERDQEALALLRKVADRQGDARERALAYFYMAVRLRSRGREDKAIIHAQKAADLDPLLRQADSLLRLLQRREERGLSTGKKAPNSSGFWSRLFGRS